MCNKSFLTNTAILKNNHVGRIIMAISQDDKAKTHQAHQNGWKGAVFWLGSVFN